MIHGCEGIRNVVEIRDDNICTVNMRGLGPRYVKDRILDTFWRYMASEGRGA